MWLVTSVIIFFIFLASACVQSVFMLKACVS